jgi:glucose/arabinose dehydrogenase
MRLSRAVGLFSALLPLASCHNTTQIDTGPALPQVLDVKLQTLGAAAGVTSPMDLQAPPGDARIFIAERTGKIRIIDASNVLLATPFLDISSRIKQPFIGEDGLLSFTFDPAYDVNGFVYVHFVDRSLDDNGDIVVERYTLSADPNVLDPTPTPIIRIAHRQASNHYGGRVMFGPDGMFYLSTGDGGGGDNQFGHAQDPTSLLGKMLRIDVSALTAASPPYAFPADNPVWPLAGRNEVWAIGLRNPFRPSFDFLTRRLYIADVGQTKREEVDVVDATLPGLNYGWNIFEGSLCSAGPCPDPTLTVPVYEYTHADGSCAIIGGYVYRGTAMPTLQGLYFFSDLCTGFVRALLALGNSAIVVQAPGANAGGAVQSIGQDGAGELYILTSDGRVQKIVP